MDNNQKGLPDSVSRRYKHVFQPLKLRHKTLKHRINFGAHTANMSVAGLATDRHLHYYLERARGGAAMIVVEPVPVHSTGVLTRGNFRHQDDSIIEGLQRITAACKAEGAVMIHQLYHIGAHGDVDNSWAPNWSPSGLPSYHDGDGSKAASHAEVEELIDAYVQAAVRAQQCGFDGVELFAIYNALIEQFWSPVNNRRDDDWGGCFEKRMRFSEVMMRRIRAAVGDDFIIGLAVSGDDLMPGGLDNQAICRIVEWHDQRRLMDYVTVGTGGYFDFTQLMPPFLLPDMMGPPLAEGIRKHLRHAVLQAESRIKTPVRADQVIADGQADMVSLVRGQIADPYLVQKTLTERDDEICPCISCNQLCWGRRHHDYWISCLVNPAVGREYLWGTEQLDAAQQQKTVLVIGAGPAGMEVARVAAERGHRVTLVDRNIALGGQFRLAASQPLRGEIGHLIHWFYQRSIERLGIDLRLETNFSAEDIVAFAADEVVLATGSRPAMTGYQRACPEQLKLPGAELENVYSINQILTGAEALEQQGLEQHVLLLDDLHGWWPASGTALYLAQRGHRVTVVSSDPVVGQELHPSATDSLLRDEYARLNIRALTRSVLKQWLGDRALIQDLNTELLAEVAFDALVLATINHPETGLHEALDRQGVVYHSIGDCVAPRRASMAFYEGRELGLRL